MAPLRVLLAAGFGLSAIAGAAPSMLRSPPPPAAPAPAPAASASADPEPGLRRPTPWISLTDPPLRRVAEAEAAKREVVKKLFAEANVTFPPASMLLRAFKREARLELWAASRASEPLTRVATYEICKLSGELGPKRKQGDQQVPEGFYILDQYNPSSTWYLAMQVSYPNASDRILGDKRDPGDEIMIHGRCASIGCLAMSDERIQELWVAASSVRWAGGVVHVHIFPSRDMGALIASPEHAEHRAFWTNLREGHDLFEKQKRLFTPRVEADGSYRFR